MTSARLIETFSSIQGEGLYVGAPQVFVRFHGCSLTCHYCDTPDTHLPLAPCRIYREGDFAKDESTCELEDNPISPERLTALIEAHYPDHRFFSLTGGEPLEQAEFIASWLPEFKKKKGRRILLETAGVHGSALAQVLPFIDIVSMDIKLSSATGMPGDFFKSHRGFLNKIREMQTPPQTYVKIVFDERVTIEEKMALEALMVAFPELIYFLQPVTPLTPASLCGAIQLGFALSKKGFDVRVLPQVHPFLSLK